MAKTIPILRVMRLIGRMPDVGRVSVSLVYGTLYAQAYPSSRAAGRMAQDRIVAEGQTSVTLPAYVDLCMEIEGRPFAEATGPTIEAALSQLMIVMQTRQTPVAAAVTP
jgi:hypothetical protein